MKMQFKASNNSLVGFDLTLALSGYNCCSELNVSVLVRKED